MFANLRPYVVAEHVKQHPFRDGEVGPLLSFDLLKTWDSDCLVEGPNSCFSPKIDKGRSKYPVLLFLGLFECFLLVLQGFGGFAQ